ncbi:hypothetical protein ADL06_09590 [Streptomyces sp. NRRL F-6491]|nr:hypothetical protein ADL06_09590 [Streptomyces sp. NRRL F-6491]KOX49621.1 hypothetical protein ADL08_08285 [Streptomyces sp. NRRL F-6492]
MGGRELRADDVRAFYRGYDKRTNRRHPLVRRLHIVREDGKFPGRAAECGTAGWPVTNSPVIVLDPMPPAPPEGLSWCPPCIGRAAERAGLLLGFAALLAAAGQEGAR